VQVDRDTGRGRAVAAGWTRNYERIRFYGGHTRGNSGEFRATWSVACRGGFTFFRSDTVRDTDTRYWTDYVRIRGDQGRCRERLVVRDPGERVVAGIEARNA
jgi:hypothetical protein